MAEISEVERKVRAVFDTYRTLDADGFLALLHRDFRFTSPYDDAIDRDAFMERCWPGVHRLEPHDLQQVLPDGETALILYELETASGERFRNMERFVFRDGLLFSIEVFFGDPQAEHGRWQSDDVRPAATVRRLIEDRYRAIRAKDPNGTMAPVAESAVVFDVLDPLRHATIESVRQRMHDWFDRFDGPVDVEIRELTVSADGDTAFAHSLNRYSGSFKAGGSTDMWVRHTSCYRLKEHGWKLVHEHLSVPFDPQTGAWSLDSQP